MIAIAGTAVGKPAPVLVLPDEQGNLIRLADFRGQPVLVSFLSHAA